MKEVLIKNAKVFTNNRFEKYDVLIHDGIIFRIEENISQESDTEIIDGSGKYLLPGFLDIHTHLDDVIGGVNLADTYSSGSEIAIKNGITTLYAFITQKKDEKLSASYLEAISKAEGETHCNVGWHITPVKKDEATLKELREIIHKGCKTIKLYTTYKEVGIYSSYEDVSFWAETLKPHNITIMVHCEDEDMLNKAKEVYHDMTEAYSHTLMRTKIAELEAVRKIIEIAEKTKTKFHIVHVSTPDAADLIIDAKNKAKITYESCPQYLLLNDYVLKSSDGHSYLCSPPIRDEATQIALYEKAINGEIDIYATDHCAFTKEDKLKECCDIQRIPKGLAGLGALVPLIYEINKYKGEECFAEMGRRLSENPAKLVGKFPQKGCIKEGSDADLVILSKGDKQHFVKSSLSNTFDPYEEFETDLDISYVLLNGEIVVRNNELTDRSNPKGELL